jgi:hypothetical protein
MRPIPPQFETYSVIDFYPALAATANTRFDMLCISHGDGNAYTWKEGGGAYTYSVKRREDESTEIEGYPMFVWDFVALNDSGDALRVVVDCIDCKLFDENGEEYSPQITNQVFRAILDAAYEIEEKDRQTPNFLLLDGTTLPNMRFRS